MSTALTGLGGFAPPLDVLRRAAAGAAPSQESVAPQAAPPAPEDVNEINFENAVATPPIGQAPPVQSAFDASDASQAPGLDTAATNAASAGPPPGAANRPPPPQEQGREPDSFEQSVANAIFSSQETNGTVEAASTPAYEDTAIEFGLGELLRQSTGDAEEAAGAEATIAEALAQRVEASAQYEAGFGSETVEESGAVEELAEAVAVNAAAPETSASREDERPELTPYASAFPSLSAAGSQIDSLV
ncbi:hypothetical protein Pan216_47900 [Planctomycetes bacterium Pan216]|uniref:Uncharacterized protein n=1 Tax=Kolteria novifilia TaxID=2527975 RepID=A0A518BAB6_9BACT|nr:hypothetical protein Pan216_47900 [Planctomycetes bacterium Pan216]